MQCERAKLYTLLHNVASVTAYAYYNVTLLYTCYNITIYAYNNPYIIIYVKRTSGKILKFSIINPSVLKSGMQIYYFCSNEFFKFDLKKSKFSKIFRKSANLSLPTVLELESSGIFYFIQISITPLQAAVLRYRIWS